MDYSIEIIIGLSISSAFLILSAALIRKLFSHKLQRSTMTLIWLIPMLKLLIPYSLSSNTLTTEMILSGDEMYVVTVNELTDSPAAIRLPLSLPLAVTYIWLFGAVLTGAIYILRHISLIRRFSCSLPCGYDIEKLKNTFGIKRKVSVRVSEFADSPFTYGIIKPVIILPKSVYLSEAELESILCHELSHIKRYDVLYRAFLALCTAIHWFNPFVWLMAELAVRDTELACDEKAVSAGNIAPDRYAETLIGMEERRFLIQSACFAGGSLKERVIGVMSRDKCKRNIVASAAAVSVFAAAALLLNICVDNTSDCIYEVAEVSVSDSAETPLYAISESISYAEGTVCIAEAADDYIEVYCVSDSDHIAVYSE